MEILILPIATLLLAYLLIIIFFRKKRATIEETKIYSRLLIINFIDAILAILTYVFAKTISFELGTIILQKIYMSLIILMTVYINCYNIAIMKINKKLKKRITNILMFSFYIVFLLIMFTNLSVINEDLILDGYGLSYNITLYSTIIYLGLIVFSSTIIFIKNKDCFKKDIPFICLIFLYIIGLIARIYTTRLKEKNLTLEINIAKDIPEKLIGDKSHIKEIINNLLSNAIKYTYKGKVELEITGILKGKNYYLKIVCKDTGRGISKENLKRLFTKFERFDVEKNSTIEGTGLGLVITKKLVELMKGKITVESEVGIGSVFTVILPQKIENDKEDLLQENVFQGTKNILSKDLKVLIVDDNKLNRKVAKNFLEALEIKQIDECSNGLECLTKIKEEKVTYDIILMDIMMPVMNGEEALNQLKKIDNFHTPIIALTADALAGAEEKYKKEGFNGYLSKPFTKEQLQTKIENILKKTSDNK